MNLIKKIWEWIDDRSGISAAAGKLLKHPVPPGSKWAYVFGSATLFCLILQVATGIALSLLYQPSSSEAYQSLDFITNRAVMGNTLRGIHYYGASAMMILLGIHMLRVYIMASYKYPREMSWISGVFLLLLVAAMGFTGQLLRWDSDGVWSSMVGAEQLGRVPLIGKYLSHLLLGGKTIGGQSLSRFFSYHVFIIPSMLFALVAFHLYLVLRNGISEPPKSGRPVEPSKYRAWYRDMLKKEGIPFWPYAGWRDAVFSALVILVIVLIAIIFGPPKLTAPPDPSLVHTVPKPDWYLNWVYALYALMPPKIESALIFLGPLILAFILLALPFVSFKGERSPIRRPWAIFGSVCVVLIVTSLIITGSRSPWSPKFGVQPLTASLTMSLDSEARTGSTVFFKRGCLFCHKIGNNGGEKGADLTYIGRRLSAGEIRIRIVNGNDKMPAYGGILSDDELRALVKFLSGRK